MCNIDEWYDVSDLNFKVIAVNEKNVKLAIILMREKAFQVSSTFLYVVYGLSPFQVYQDVENCKIIFLSNKLRWNYI